MRTIYVLGVLLIMASHIAHAVTVTDEEKSEARRWVAAKFEGKQEALPRESGLIVLANHDVVQQNARGGKPMRIVDAQYTRGLYCHAYSNVIVRLPGPGKRFEAIAGVDTNDQTRGGRGSVVYSVRVGNAEVWRSEVMREGMAGVAAGVDLAGATEFALEIGDAGTAFRATKRTGPTRG